MKPFFSSKTCGFISNSLAGRRVELRSRQEAFLKGRSCHIGRFNHFKIPFALGKMASFREMISWFSYICFRKTFWVVPMNTCAEWKEYKMPKETFLEYNFDIYICIACFVFGRIIEEFAVCLYCSLFVPYFLTLPIRLNLLCSSWMP